jgi:hypothetical protein
MWRTLCRWVGVLIILSVFSLPAQAQEDPAPKGENDPPVKEYAVACLTVMLVLVVVCKPSRSRG